MGRLLSSWACTCECFHKNMEGATSGFPLKGEAGINHECSPLLYCFCFPQK